MVLKRQSVSSAPSAGLGIKSVVTMHPNKVFLPCKQVLCGRPTFQMCSVSFEKFPWGSNLVGKYLRNWFQVAFHGEVSRQCLHNKAVF